MVTNTIIIAFVLGSVFLLVKASENAVRIRKYDEKHNVDDPVVRFCSYIDGTLGVLLNSFSKK